jgi:hypothetical protein
LILWSFVSVLAGAFLSLYRPASAGVAATDARKHIEPEEQPDDIDGVDGTALAFRPGAFNQDGLHHFGALS